MIPTTWSESFFGTTGKRLATSIITYSWEKMAQLGLPSFVVRWLTGFLCERQQRVRMGGHKSEWLDVLCRVPQGTRTGPIAFFLLSMTSCQNRHHANFVDDTTVWELCEDRGATSEMAAIVAETEAWSAVNNMVLNGDKTKEMGIHFNWQHWCRHCPGANRPTLLWNRSPASNSLGAPLTTSSRS